MPRSLFNGVGYLLADDRCSGGKLDEADMLGCKHCEKLMKKPDWQIDGGFCHSCFAPVCGHCATRLLKHGCETVMRRLNAGLDDHYRQEQNAKILGL